MRLYLMQHGDAVPKQTDPRRPLSETGRRDVAAISRLLAGAGVRPERVFHSGKLRALETAETLAAALGSGITVDAMTGLNPKDPVEPVARAVEDWTADTMLVGHLPFMAKLVASLVAGNPKLAITAFVPGTVVCLERDEEGSLAIAWMARPEIAAGHGSAAGTA